MSAPFRASVILAVEHSSANVAAIMSTLGVCSHPDSDFVVCYTQPDDAIACLDALAANVRVLRCAPGSRIPHMWRDGILNAYADTVALLTGHCIPAQTWITTLLATTLESDEAGVGGYFTNRTDANARDWAIYLLRYVNFSRPRSASAITHIAADNAVYKKSQVLACPDLLEDGFWETEYHKRFRQRGLRLRLSPALEVVHSNAYSTNQFAAQRREHGFMFGRDRARGMSTLRLCLFAFALPLIPAVLYAKVIAATMREKWLVQAPLATYFWLLLFVLNWSTGEARGLVHELRRRLGP